MSRHTVPSSLDCARKHAASIRLLVGDIRDDLGEALQHGEHASVVLVDDLTDDLAASAAELQRHATLAASVAEELRRATTLGAA